VSPADWSLAGSAANGGIGRVREITNRDLAVGQEPRSAGAPGESIDVWMR